MSQGFELWHCCKMSYSCLLLVDWLLMPSVLWHCWLGGRKGIWPVKNWVVGCWHGYLSGARCRLAYGPVDAAATHCLLLQYNPYWFLPFWYQLTWVVPDKGPLNVCVCVWLFRLMKVTGMRRRAWRLMKPSLSRCTDRPNWHRSITVSWHT